MRSRPPSPPRPHRPTTRPKAPPLFPLLRPSRRSSRQRWHHRRRRRRLRARLPAAGRRASTLARPTDSEWARVDAYLQDRLLGAGDFAFGVAVSIDGVPVHAASFGDRNSPNMVPPPPEPPTESAAASTIATTTTSTTTTIPVVLEPVDVSDRFRIASISKVITGTVVLQLVADGTLTLDEPVGELLGDHLGVDVTGRPPAAITVRQLLSHTSGFSEFYDTFFSRGVESCREAAARGLDAGVQFDPGTTYEYSNMNFCMLSILIEIVTGTALRDRRPRASARAARHRRDASRRDVRPATRTRSSTRRSRIATTWRCSTGPARGWRRRPTWSRSSTRSTTPSRDSIRCRTISPS